MAIKAIPVIRDQVILSDLLDGDYERDDETGELTARADLYKSVSAAVAKLEGKCEPSERAWVSVRQATEGDNLRRAARTSRRTVRWEDDGVQETRSDNLREGNAFEVYLCLTGAGNLMGGDGKPLFKFKQGADYDKVDMSFEEFLEAYGRLPTEVTNAIRRAVLLINPNWDWFSGE